MSNAKHNRNADPNKFEPWLHRFVPPRLHAEARRAWRQGPHAQLAWLLMHMLNLRDDGTGLVSIKTKANRSQILHQAFSQLPKLGFKIANILSFNQKHLVALIALWAAEEQEPSTIAIRRSVLSVFTKVIGKGGMVPGVKDFDKLGFSSSIAKRTTVALEDRSWTDAQYIEASKAAHLLDYRYGHIVDVMWFLGLRGKEGYMLEPNLADCGTHLHLTKGTKNGRPRNVPIDTPEKRQLIDRCKAVVPDVTDSISGKFRGLKETVNWYKEKNELIGATLAGKIGKQPHGLRHTFAQNELMKRGVTVTVKGAAGIPVDAPPLNSAGRKVARLEVAEAMGHSRVSVTGAYAGSLRTIPVKNADQNVEAAASNAPIESLPATVQDLTPQSPKEEPTPDE